MPSQFKQDNPGCDCCECTEAPSCTLSGTCSGEDVTLNWTVSGVGITSAVVTDNRGNSWTLTVPPTSGSFTVTGGCCYRYELTVINDCGSSVCSWNRGTSGFCVCTTCTYTSGGGTVTVYIPSDYCIPCGCQRGKGTEATLTISGVLSEYNTYFDCYYTDTRCQTINSYPPSPYSTPNCFMKYIGFDILNGTYAFELTDASCEVCGAKQCSIEPSYYLLGTATVEDHYDLQCSSPLSTPSPTVSYYTIQIAIAVTGANPGTSPLTVGPKIDCASVGGGSVAIRPIYRRISPTVGTWQVFDLAAPLTPTDSCGFKYGPIALATGGTGQCCNTGPGIYWHDALGRTGWGDSLVKAVTAYATIELYYTTIGIV